MDIQAEIDPRQYEINESERAYDIVVKAIEKGLLTGFTIEHVYKPGEMARTQILFTFPKELYESETGERI